MLRRAVWWLATALAAAALPAADVAAAEANLKRVEMLVQAGAAPRTALEAARLRLQDARLEQFLRDTLYTGNVTPEQLPALLEAAQSLRDRAAQALAHQQKLVDEGVATVASLEPVRLDLLHADRQLDLARSRARLIEELAEMAGRESRFAEEAERDLALRVEGKGTFTDEDFLFIETAFYDRFSKALPVSARGATAVHRSLGFDHRDRFDVALNPDQREGRWLLDLLDRLSVPYIAFRRAVSGQATGAHIHVGLPSPRF